MMKPARLIALSIAALACGEAGAQPGGPPRSLEAIAAAAATPIDAQRARATARRLADMLEQSYVFPDVGRRYAAALRSRAESGAYDDLRTAKALADRLSDDVLAISPDNHLRVFAGGPVTPDMAGPPRVVAPPSAGGGPRPPGPPPRPPLAPMEQARWLAPGVAFVRFNFFPPGDAAAAAAAARFMAEHADAKVLIFDVRTHAGGGRDQMDAIFPYLFSKETDLIGMDTRASVAADRGTRPGGEPTVRHVSADGDVERRMHVVRPHPTEKRLFDAEVFVLTSRFTGSAGEHFALALKRRARTTLIGEPTGGAGHFGGVRPIDPLFVAFIPVGRTYDPVTGQGWEGVGVAPHVAAAPERALVEALVRSGVASHEAERINAQIPSTLPPKRGMAPGPRAGGALSGAEGTRAGGAPPPT